MAQEDKKIIQIVHERTAAGCLSEGWRLLADNIWGLLRLSWPLIAINTVVGVAITFNQHPDANNKILNISLIIVAGLLYLIWLWHTALLMRRYNTTGFFPTTTMFRLWREDGANAARSCLRQLRLLLTSPRQWLTFIVVLVVAELMKALISLLFMMPLLMTSIIYREANFAIDMGDAIDLPSYIKWFYPLMSGINAALCSVTEWVLLMPLAFFFGKLLASRKVTIAEQ